MTTTSRGRVLVTGGTGFLGSRIVRLLVEQGETVRVLARPSSSLRALAGIDRSRLDVVEGDITIGHTVFRALAGCHRLYHVASDFRLWAPDRRVILDAAVVGTRETLTAARQRGIEKIVVTSSTTTVGTSSEPLVLDETSALDRPHAETYVVAKRRAELVALEMAAGGLPLVIVNPATLFGPGDYKPTPSGQAIVSYLRYALPFAIPVPAGGFGVVDVDDVARGHLLAMEHGRVGERYILGGENLTFRQVFALLSTITGRSGPGFTVPSPLLTVGAWLLERRAALTGVPPELTYKMARDYVGHYVWTASDKAKRELGYEFRDAKATLTRAVRFYADSGFLPKATEESVRTSLAFG